MTFDGGQFGVSSTIEGVSVDSRGGNGADGNDHSSSGNVTGGDGAPGGTGGNIAVTWTSGHLLTGSRGMFLGSLGGNGGAAGNGSTSGGTGQAASTAPRATAAPYR